MTSAKILEGLGYGLDESALKTLRRWRLKPAARALGSSLAAPVRVATMASRPDASGFPPGPDERFDLDIREESFPVIADLLARYGDVVGVTPETRTAPSVIVNHPDAVRRVLGPNYRNYVKGVGRDRVRLLLGDGLIVSDGELWHRQRRMMQPAFHQEVLARLAAAMWECNRELVGRWRAAAEAGRPVDVTRDVARLTLDIILRCLFGDDLEGLVSGPEGDPFAFLTEQAQRDLTTVQLFRAPKRRIRGLVERRRREGRARPDLLGMLLEARDSESGEPMSDRQVTDEVTTLIVAGHETSAATLAWAWYLLSQNPEAEARLHREVDALAPAAVSDPAALQSLAYPRQVLDETLRLYPPGWLLSRRALEADSFGPYTIPAGTDVFIAPYFLHRHAGFWSDPERFDPDRFGDGAGLAHRFAYIPFGAGPRRCIGVTFAQAEMQIHVGLVARHLRLRFQGEGPPALEPRINLRSRDPLVFRALTRSPPATPRFPSNSQGGKGTPPP